MDKINACRLEMNGEKNGIELYFDGKPDDATRAGLKVSGFRWNGKTKCWWARNDPKKLEAAKFYAGMKELPSIKQIPSPKAEFVFPDYDKVGRWNEKIFRNSDENDWIASSDVSGYYFDINAHYYIYSRRNETSFYIQPLENAMRNGKVCKTYLFRTDCDSCQSGNKLRENGIKSVKDFYNAAINDTMPDIFSYKGIQEDKGCTVFSPFVPVKPIKTPAKWTIAHVWKAMLSGQIWGGKVDYYETDDYALDSARDFLSGCQVDVISAAKDLIESSSSGYQVRYVPHDEKSGEVHVSTYTYEARTFYYDETCNLELAKQKRAAKENEKNSHNKSMDEQVLDLEPYKAADNRLWTIKYLDRETNSGLYGVKEKVIATNGLFFIDYDDDGGRIIAEPIYDVISIEPYDIDPEQLYSAEDDGADYRQDSRVIYQGWRSNLITGYALSEKLAEGFRPRNIHKAGTYEAMEKDLRSYYEPIHDKFGTVSRMDIFNVGKFDYKAEHDRLVAEWERIPRKGA